MRAMPMPQQTHLHPLPQQQQRQQHHLEGPSVLVMRWHQEGEAPTPLQLERQHKWVHPEVPLALKQQPVKLPLMALLCHLQGQR